MRLHHRLQVQARLRVRVRLRPHSLRVLPRSSRLALRLRDPRMLAEEGAEVDAVEGAGVGEGEEAEQLLEAEAALLPLEQ